MRALLLAAALVGCGGGYMAPEQGDCAPLRYSLCLAALPDPLPPWHCTDGADRGRAWCAICSPAAPDFCAIAGAPGVVCVSSCATCQPAQLPPCRPEGGTDDMGVADMAGW